MEKIKPKLPQPLKDICKAIFSNEEAETSDEVIFHLEY